MQRRAERPVDGDGRLDLEIRAIDVHKSFGGNAVLRGVSLDVHRGELLAIVGGSGAGKTVLLEHLYGHLHPDRGHVLVADHEDPGLPLRDLDQVDEEAMDRIRIHWAVVFQQNALFTGTVYENIALWLREVKRVPESEIRIKARDVIEAVDLEIEDLQKDRAELSGGMAKRVAIARALAMDPAIMFYDEPTTGLDPHHAAQIHDLIRVTHDRRSSGRESQTTVIVTHDKDLLYRLEPRVVMLHDGLVYFDGPYPEFRETESDIIQPYFDLMPALHQRVAFDDT